MNVISVLALSAILLVAFAVVTGLRWSLGKREDDHLHYSDREQQLVTAQVSIAHKLDVLDRWKTALLIATILAGVAAIGLHTYNMWMSGSGL
jgi:sterol desaturase/sphingolipid hydroxylase (fatty acid hydroxylase superfamily)